MREKEAFETEPGMTCVDSLMILEPSSVTLHLLQVGPRTMLVPFIVGKHSLFLFLL